MVRREHDILKEAKGSLVDEEYKPKNRGWMNEKEISRNGGGELA
jgi:hypothetical protein